eukprot:PLAT3125.1.p1 GENE.PLAT3125.1~~PLAT3125.1.p1  ORF type:complete len:734 (+),score=269.03 PLAT3125.1:131-2203(+)
MEAVGRRFRDVALRHEAESWSRFYEAEFGCIRALPVVGTVSYGDAAAAGADGAEAAPVAAEDVEVGEIAEDGAAAEEEKESGDALSSSRDVELPPGRWKARYLDAALRRRTAELQSLRALYGIKDAMYAFNDTDRVLGVVADMVYVCDPRLAHAISCMRQGALRTVFVDSATTIQPLKSAGSSASPMALMTMDTIARHIAPRPGMPATIADLPDIDADGFIGYAVHLLQPTPGYEDHRDTVLWSVFRDLQVFETEAAGNAWKAHCDAQVPPLRSWFVPLDNPPRFDRARTLATISVGVPRPHYLTRSPAEQASVLQAESAALASALAHLLWQEEMAARASLASLPEAVLSDVMSFLDMHSLCAFESVARRPRFVGRLFSARLWRPIYLSTFAKAVQLESAVEGSGDEAEDEAAAAAAAGEEGKAEAEEAKADGEGDDQAPWLPHDTSYKMRCLQAMLAQRNVELRHLRAAQPMLQQMEAHAPRDGSIPGMVSELVWCTDAAVGRAISLQRQNALLTVVTTTAAVMIDFRKTISGRPWSFMPVDLSEAGAGGAHGMPARVEELPDITGEGFIGYAVNLLQLEEQHEPLRETVLWAVIKDLAIFATTAQAEAWQRHCAALDPPQRAYTIGCDAVVEEGVTLRSCIPQQPRPDWRAGSVVDRIAQQEQARNDLLAAVAHLLSARRLQPPPLRQ